MCHSLEVISEITVFVSRDPSIGRNILNFLLSQTKRNIFWFQIRVDDLAYPVKIVKANQQLLR